ncbi:MAG TPA: AMP-binding protein [Gammaproteobacteria bacterium]|nr:AMP-binding protein [Gammaproteobacteria bacterium]
MAGGPALDPDGLLRRLPQRISEPVHRWACEAPGHLALMGDGCSWTYADFERVVADAAALLRDAGVRGGDRVLLVSENCPGLGALIMACSELDAWAVILNARLSPREVDAIREHCGARSSVYTVSVSPDAARHARDENARFLEHERLGPVAVGPVREVRPEPVEASGAKQVAAMIYTSGTTGEPKGVMLSHRNLLFVAAVSGARRGLDADDLVYAVLPLSHSFGLAATFLGTVWAGGCAELVPRFGIRHLLRALSEGGVTVFQGVPAMYARILEYARHHPGEVRAPSLRYISSGGAPLGAGMKSEVESLLGVPLHNGYGLTETSPTVSQTDIDDPPRETHVGRVLDGVEIRIADPRGRPLPDGEVGELWIRGPNVMKGYYRAPEATAAVLTDDGWFNSQDLARIEPGGELSIVGRSKELIIRSGFNVYPPEVEAVLNSHPGITQSAVVGRPAGDNEEVVAYVQPDPRSKLDLEALRAWLRERLSPYKLPAEIIVLQEMPAAATGKILKHRLKQQAQSEAGGRG